MDEHRVICPFSAIQQTLNNSLGTIRMFYFEGPTAKTDFPDLV